MPKYYYCIVPGRADFCGGRRYALAKPAPCAYGYARARPIYAHAKVEVALTYLTAIVNYGVFTQILDKILFLIIWLWI